MNQQLEKDEAKLKGKLSSYYDVEARKLEKEIGAFYQTYGEKDIIEYRTLMQTMSDADKRLLIERIDEFEQKYPEYGYILPVRENIYKLNRLEGLQQSLLMQQLEIGAIDNDELRKHLEKQAKRGADAMLKELGFGESFNALNSDIIKKLINQKWVDGKNFSDRIWNNRQKLADYLNNDFAAGIARGDSYEKLMRELKKKFGNVSRRDMYRLIYTEGTFALNEGMITPFEEDFEEYRFSIADSNACGKCQAINGKTFKIKDRKAGVNFPPLHSWCRCSFTIEIPDDFIEQYEAKHGGKQPSKVLQDSSKAGKVSGIKSRADAEKALLNEVGFDMVEDSFHGMDEQLAISNTKQLQALEKKFGIVHKSSGTISSTSLGSRTKAYVSSSMTNPAKQNLSLCPSAFRSRNEMIDSLEREIRDMWSMPCKKSNYEVYDVTHEYGHMLQNRLIQDHMESLGWSSDKPMAFVDFSKKTQKAMMKWYNKARKDTLDSCFDEIMDIAKKNNPDFKLSEQLSRYGHTDKAEFFAEVFANSQLGEPNELGKAMNIWLAGKGY